MRPTQNCTPPEFPAEKNGYRYILRQPGTTLSCVGRFAFLSITLFVVILIDAKGLSLSGRSDVRRTVSTLNA
jgi:hypothetical protein